jgi:hypothetical protein
MSSITLHRLVCIPLRTSVYVVTVTSSPKDVKDVGYVIVRVFHSFMVDTNYLARTMISQIIVKTIFIVLDERG